MYLQLIILSPFHITIKNIIIIKIKLILLLIFNRRTCNKEKKRNLLSKYISFNYIINLLLQLYRKHDW